MTHYYCICLERGKYTEWFYSDQTTADKARAQAMRHAKRNNLTINEKKSNLDSPR